MNAKHVLVSFLSSALLLACGGSQPAPAASPGAPAASTAPTTVASSPEAPASAPIVRFDDLGVSLAVPSYMRVMGDDELATRIRASANQHLTEDLKANVTRKIGLPLLTLAKADARTADDALDVLLLAEAVPADTSASELMSEEVLFMKENLQDFAVDRGPSPITVDGVAGTEIEDSYVLRTNAGPTKMRAHVRLFLRDNRAFTISAVWRSSAPPARELEATSLLDGVRFYEPTP
ncbi:MAG: hypothetical protein ACRELY_29865 [Polyangiaceae bacterium]